ncbi:hypothetical protein GCM10008107_27060 [Psychrosphaera saromensis]|uniref:Uncharacterized protein n=1 Tax=Psychrosphaera saromensis TaxID=716813 RepID=A0A2S7UVK0_9GAMM|nr:hypothetical protein [Psychrosphaera saromensis]PQJ54016.1 hypothetical protein BTO11_10390 [Psychrosphaera saromensis]GHB76185.1 hypothetical protein GCM10008107_27060 [Psychrosphaera saromensis]GLQ14491.1 hypothetical protein GCM10007917_19460 [Psychrosphaera saromensis]
MDSSVLPITVIVAISLFVIKEAVELYRRIMANRHKIAAIKKLLSSEIEKNNWVVKSLQRHLNGIQDGWYKSEYIIANTYPKGVRLEEKRSDGGGGGSPIFEVSTSVFDKIVFELPVLDADLFALAETAYEGVAEIKHITDSLIENITNKVNHISPDFMIAFCEYALDELNNSHTSLCSLYLKCTGNELTSHKLRTYT